jgi:putative sigma-54 modulation protein
VDAKPLTTEEAIMQMDLLHREFLVFVDAESHHIKVLYRMEEGKLGLIDTAGDEPIGNA